MRENKFRAWDPEKKEMVLNVAVRNNYFIYAEQTSGNDSWDVKYIEIPEFKIMQYIGLKDKKGKDIYEGDIIFQENVKNGISSYFYGVVEYQGTGFYLKCIKGGGINSHYAFSHYGDDENLKKGEIVGNIYENPELLEVKDA